MRVAEAVAEAAGEEAHLLQGVLGGDVQRNTNAAPLASSREGRGEQAGAASSGQQSDLVVDELFRVASSGRVLLPLSAMLRIACLGDSLTKGNESLYDGGPKPRALKLLGNYPRVLSSLLPPTLPAPSSRRGSGRSLQVVVRNFGRGGATASFDGRNVYGRSAQFDAALAWRPHVALLLLGTNDARSDARSDAVHRGIVRLAARLRKLPSRPALALMLPPRVLYNETFSGLPPGTLERRRTELVLPALRRAARELAPRTGESALCTKSSFRLWDTSEALPDDPSLYVGDGIHPSPAGAERLATAVAEKLRHCLRVCEYPGAAPNNICRLGSELRAARATYRARRRRARRRQDERRQRGARRRRAGGPAGWCEHRRGGASSSECAAGMKGGSRSEDDGWRSTPQ